MKRSEIIANVVKDLDGLYNANTVNSILFLLECYGMKPPYRAVGPFEENFTWEPEDEPENPHTDSNFESMLLEDYE